MKQDHPLIDATLEEATCGKMLDGLTGSCDWVYSTILEVQPHWFACKSFRKVWEALQAILKGGEVPDLMNIRDWLKDHGNSTLDYSWLVDLAAKHTAMSDLTYESGRLRDLYIRREVAKVSHKYSNESMDLLTPIAETITNLASRLAEASNVSEMGVVTASTLIDQSISEGSPLSSLVGSSPYSQTGISWVDKTLTALPGTVTVVAARMKVGKSIMAVQMACESLKLGKKVLCFSLEMGEKEWAARALSHLAGEPSDIIMEHGASYIKKDMGYFQSLLSGMKIIPGYAGFPWSQISSKTQEYVIKKECDVAIIDYFEYIKPMSSDAKRVDVGWANLSQAITGMAKRLNIAIILVAQLHRIDDGHEPNESNLAQTDQLAKDATGIIFIYYGKETTPGKPPTYIKTMGRHRGGAKKEVEANRALTIFKDKGFVNEIQW